MSVNFFDREPNIKIMMLGTGLDVKGGVTSVERLILDHSLPRMKIQHVSTIGQGSAWQNLFLFGSAIVIMIWTILSNNVDIVHIHFSERGSTFRKSILLFVGLIFRKPVILHAHGATYQEFYERLPTFLRKLLIYLFSKCSRLIVLSKSWQDFYVDEIAIDKSKVMVLYNPVNVPCEIPDRLNRKAIKIIFLGLIGKRNGPLEIAKSFFSFPAQDKGSFELINAFANLQNDDLANTELILAGNGDLEKANQLIDKLKLSDKITILNWLNPQERDDLLALADIFVLPSYNEGLPMSMLESMAWGLPVVVTPVGGIPEIIFHEHNGWLVEPGKQDQLVNALQCLINNESLRLSLGHAARCTVKDLNIENYMNSLLDLYISVLREKYYPSEVGVKN